MTTFFKSDAVHEEFYHVIRNINEEMRNIVNRNDINDRKNTDEKYPRMSKRKEAVEVGGGRGSGPLV